MPIRLELTVSPVALSPTASTALKHSLLETSLALPAWIVPLPFTPMLKASALPVAPLTALDALKPAPTASTVLLAILAIG
jgi:hypothetical protein